jgi:hypothetical protein
MKRAYFKGLSDRFVVRPTYFVSTSGLKHIWKGLPIEVLSFGETGYPIFDPEAVVLVEMLLETIQLFTTPPLHGPNQGIEDLPQATGEKFIQLTPKEYQELTTIPVTYAFEVKLWELHEIVYDL